MRTTIVTLGFLGLAIVAGARPAYSGTLRLTAGKVALMTDNFNCYTQNHLSVQAGYNAFGYRERQLCSIDTTVELDNSARLKIKGQVLPGFDGVGGYSFVDLNVSLENAIGTGLSYSKSSGKGELGLVSRGLSANPPYIPFSYSPSIKYVNSLDITLAGNSYRSGDPLKLDQELDRGKAFNNPVLSSTSYGNDLSKWSKFSEDLAEGNTWLGKDEGQVNTQGYFTDVLVNKSNPSGFLQGLESITIDYIPTNEILGKCLVNKDCFNFQEAIGYDTKFIPFTDIPYWQSERPVITGEFSPSAIVPNIQMADLAKALGFKHLNWMQLITASTDPDLVAWNGLGDPVSSQGFILTDGFSGNPSMGHWDSVKGGNVLWNKDLVGKDQQADCIQGDEYYPYYNIVKEEDNPNVSLTNLLMAKYCKPGSGSYAPSILEFTDKKQVVKKVFFDLFYSRQRVPSPGTLSYYDAPTLESGEFEFVTFLSGVNADKSVVPIVVKTGNTFKMFSTRWSSNVTTTGEGDITIYSLATPIEQIEELDNVTYTGKIKVKEVITTISDEELAQLRSVFGDFKIIDLGDIDVTENPPTSVSEPSAFLGLLATVLGLRFYRHKVN